MTSNPSEQQQPVLEPENQAASPAPDDINALKAQLEVARAEIDDLKDKFLRAKAEIENVRRRAELDIASTHKFAVERFASEIIAVRDSLDLARNVEIKGEQAVQKMHEGVELTLKLLDSIFLKFGISVVDPKGEKFDHNRHQAISTVESAETPANHVVSVVQKGYLMHDRVLRPAMVVVSRGPAAQGAPEGGDKGAEGA